jgi:uncharacterized protein YcaQ
MSVHELSRTDARRIAVRAQLLGRDRPTDLVAVVRHLGLLQIDPTAPIAPSADLVLWSRLGSSYDPEALVEALADRDLVELQGFVRPAEDVALLRAEMAAWPGSGTLLPWQLDHADWLDANELCGVDVLERLSYGGPLPSRELPDTCEVPWRSSGWTNNQNVTRVLDFLVARGEVAVAGRRGRERLWDLAERVYPDDPVPAEDEALRIRQRRRLAALGIARATSAKVPMEPNDVGEAGEPATVVGVKGTWRVDPAYLAPPGEPFAGRAALLSPFDRLVVDRRRALELFEFDYQLEMFKPAARRRWGYYALPILYDDRLVGKLDAIHEDQPFTREMTAAVRDQLEDLAGWLHADLSLPD